MKKYIISVKTSNDLMLNKQMLNFVISEVNRNNSKVTGTLEDISLIYVESENPETLKNITYVEHIEEDKDIQLNPPDSEIQ